MRYLFSKDDFPINRTGEEFEIKSDIFHDAFNATNCPSLYILKMKYMIGRFSPEEIIGEMNKEYNAKFGHLILSTREDYLDSRVIDAMVNDGADITILFSEYKKLNNASFGDGFFEDPVKGFKSIKKEYANQFRYGQFTELFDAYGKKLSVDQIKLALTEKEAEKIAVQDNNFRYIKEINPKKYKKLRVTNDFEI